MLLPFLSAFFIADAAILFRIVLQTLFKTWHHSHDVQIGYHGYAEFIGIVQWHMISCTQDSQVSKFIQCMSMPVLKQVRNEDLK